ncbi:MAG: 4Fe-4S binding protein [Flavobacteriaceae bacterium]|nr:MAG: 4Fe-4S binding protein [Flavobacteriaceae bacterium]
MKPRQRLRKGIILTSFFLFPATFYYFSPVLIVESSSKGIINGSFIIFLLLFISSLVFGRVFCGWVCPAAGCQESIFPVINKVVTGGDFIKWLIWLPWILSIMILSIRAGGYSKVDFFYRTTHGLSIGNYQGLLAYLFVLLVLIVLPAFIIGKRSFCHHLCWMAPFMILGRKIHSAFKWQTLFLKADPEICKNCRTCTQNCPMSLPVDKMVMSKKMENVECVLCGTCVDGCKQGAIKYYWGKN